VFAGGLLEIIENSPQVVICTIWDSPCTSFWRWGKAVECQFGSNWLEI